MPTCTSMDANRNDAPSFAPLIGEGAAMRDLRAVLAQLALAEGPVLLYGETGSGKGLCARLLHGAGPRARAPFIALNCAGSREDHLVRELFGAGPGLRRDAAGGVVLLDEIGDLPPCLQAALAAAIDKDGSVRLIATTQRDLVAEVRMGRFRADLLYRLDCLSVTVPPLRQRREDIPALAQHFLAIQRGLRPTAPRTVLSPALLIRLLGYAWPGNVRELAQAITRAHLVGRGPALVPADLPEALRVAAPLPFQQDEVVPVRVVQRRYAAWVLARSAGRRRDAARRLGINPRTLAGWLDDPADPMPPEAVASLGAP